MIVIRGLPGKCPLELCNVVALVVQCRVESSTYSCWASPMFTRMVGTNTLEEKCLVVTASKRCSPEEKWMLMYNIQ